KQDGLGRADFVEQSGRDAFFRGDAEAVPFGPHSQAESAAAVEEQRGVRHRRAPSFSRTASQAGRGVRMPANQRVRLPAVPLPPACYPLRRYLARHYWPEWSFRKRYFGLW